MKALIVSLAAASLLLGLAATAAAAAPRKKHKHHAGKAQVWNKSAHANRARDATGYQEWNPNYLSLGSNAWWHALDREGRGGHNRP
jgi:sugar (pentulose or hexulose) kinase